MADSASIDSVDTILTELRLFNHFKAADALQAEIERLRADVAHLEEQRRLDALGVPL